MTRRDAHSQLDAYVDGTLSPSERQAFEAHLAEDPILQAALDDWQHLHDTATTLPSSIEPSRDLWPDIAARLEPPHPSAESAPTRVDRAARPHRLHRRLLRKTALVSVPLILVILGLGWYLSLPRWSVEALTGTPQINDATIQETGYIRQGQWLETDAMSRAQVDVASIGKVLVDPNSRMRVLTTRLTEHRIALDRGRIEASIWAPPRLFFVETPEATAIDLGCAYTLEVDSTGTTHLHVTSGWVALVRDNREVLVPAGASGRTYPGIGPGTPYFEDATSTFKALLYAFDTGDRTMGTLEQLIQEARLDDTLTLWHLLQDVEAAQRPLLFDALATFVPPPTSVTRAGILALDQQQLNRWKSVLRAHWIRNTSPFWLDVLQQAIPN